MTSIESNGSKWAGQEPDTIEQLIQVLKEHTIEEHFFFKLYDTRREEWVVGCPISKFDGEKKEWQGKYMFFGNFEEVSHVFRIITDDPVIIKNLREAIINNAGWKKYIGNLKTNKRA